MRFKRGFTLIEIMIALTVLGITMAGVSRLGTRFFYQQQLSSEASRVRSFLEEAQASSHFGLNGSSFGVKIENGEVILFEGDSFAGRNQNRDLKFSLAPSVEVSGINEVVFSAGGLNPALPGAIILENPGGQISLEISSLGLISVK